jgi:hypothetical protein
VPIRGRQRSGPRIQTPVKSDVAFKPFALVTFIWASQMKVTRLPAGTGGLQ